jgi:hypothetical protein
MKKNTAMLKDPSLEEQADIAFDLSQKIGVVLHGTQRGTAAAALAAALGQVTANLPGDMRKQILTDVMETANASAEALTKLRVRN